MADGSNMGITAGRAIDTIIGEKDQPTEEEQATPKQVRERVMNAPSPLDGEMIFDRFGEDGYSVASDCIAKAFLLAEEESPGILEEKRYFSEENTVYKDLWGKELDPMTAVWNYCTSKWPGFDNWIGGASGFMVGFAYNTARYILGQPPVSNPALLTIETSDGSDG